ncbi:DUF3618 domain-containing protein [Nocardioides sp. GCM10027113]|uniref:DUF3618 domain-containing protein n=1 Tax=unclassified Nocardioides TaxID=2615069 RepID=UPI003606C983
MSSNGRHVAGTTGATTEDLEAQVERQREQLASTVDALHDRLDVSARARHRARSLRERLTGPGGRPRPEVLAVAALVVATGAAAVVLRVRRRR